MTTITRKDYMDGKATHEAYYSQLAKAQGIRFNDPTSAFMARVKEAVKIDKNLNSIPLGEWDSMANSLHLMAAPFAERGEQNTLSTRVCMLKQAACDGLENT